MIHENTSAGNEIEMVSISLRCTSSEETIEQFVHSFLEITASMGDKISKKAMLELYNVNFKHKSLQHETLRNILTRNNIFWDDKNYK